jgi:hypothetical protein
MKLLMLLCFLSSASLALASDYDYEDTQGPDTRCTSTTGYASFSSLKDLTENCKDFAGIAYIYKWDGGDFSRADIEGDYMIEHSLSSTTRPESCFIGNPAQIAIESEKALMHYNGDHNETRVTTKTYNSANDTLLLKFFLEKRKVTKTNEMIKKETDGEVVTTEIEVTTIAKLPFETTLVNSFAIPRCH